jgi:hypothetical protein
MSEQGGPDYGSPAVAGPEGASGTAEQQTQAEIDWAKRYADLQPEYTRASQENASLRQRQELYDLLITSEDPDTRRQVAERLGYQLEEEQQQSGQPFEEAEPWEVYDQRIAHLEQQQVEREQQEADVQRAREVRGVLDQRLEQLPGLDREDQDWVLAYAINALPVAEDGYPDIGQAFEVFTERENARQRRWAQTKRGAPSVPSNGQAATEVPDLDKREDRVDWMVRRLQEQEQA